MNDFAQFALFCCVGGLNTIVDFGTFNVLTSRPFDLRRIPANIGATTAAMTTSFIINSVLVFEDKHYLATQIIRFLAVTLFSAYVIQTAVIYLTSYVWTRPAEIVGTLVTRRYGSLSFGSDFIQRNFVKCLAVAAGILWNFFWYKYFVF